MTAALVAMSLVIGGMGVALALAVRWGMKAKDEATRSGDLCREQERRADAMQEERDEYSKHLTVESQQNAVLRVRLATAEAQRNQSQRDATNALVEKVRSGNAQGAIDAAGSVFGLPILPDVPQAGDAGTSDGHRGAAGVPASKPPATPR